MSARIQILIQVFMYMLMKEARRQSLTELMEKYDLNESDFEDIKQWFKDNGIKI